MTESSEERVRQAAARLFPEGRELTPLAGGGNSRVFRLETGNGSVALKAYRRPTMDGRSRLAVEFTALRLLGDLGITALPKALAKDTATDVGGYSWLEGENPVPSLATPQDADALSAFLVHLQSVRAHPRCQEFFEAAEARFSLEGVARILEGRLERLERTAAPDVENEALREFLAEAFRPGLVRVLVSSRARLGDGAFCSELPRAGRMLSPSDFGLHNAVRTGDGRLAFVDFEYFGWDDPAKALADVCLHPAMALSPALRRRFLEGFWGRVDHPLTDRLRFRAALPLFALKWCLILLNVFLPGFGPVETAQRSALARERLLAAGSMLARALRAADSPHPELEDA